METTENQRMAADLISMMRAQGMTTLAEQLEQLLDGAWQEGRLAERNDQHRMAPTLSPYKEMGR